MKILYISALSSERLIDDIHKRTGNNPGYAVQKFSRLLVSGLIANKVDTIALTNSPINRSNSSILFALPKQEQENGVIYKYAPIINLPFLKQMCSFLYIFFYVFFWGIGNRREKAVICSVLNVSASLGAILATKLSRVQNVGVVTDIYEFMVGNSSSRSIFFSIACWINKMYVSSFDKYVLLTEQMNALVNPKRKPHIVMEALCDSQILTEASTEYEKARPRTMLYAGGLNEKYGLKMLVEAFLKADVDGKLVLYGDGPYVKELKTVCETTDKIEYRGVAANEEVVAAEYSAAILVNPRFTTEAFSPYSFPSKNMEYMASGTPLLTTKLPGMPLEYHEYVYLFEEETVAGYLKAICNVFEKFQEELDQMGAKAKAFVLENKNNIIQARRVIDLLQL